MKILFLIFGLLLTQAARALPVVDENAAAYGMITIYPDNENQHHYYVAPNVVMITQGADGIPEFSYSEYRKNIFRTVGVITMTLTPVFSQQDLEAAKANILKKDPTAEFSSVPFISSSLQLTGELEELIEDNQCNHQAGLIGQEQSCSMVLTSKGRDIFLNSLERKNLFVTLDFTYQIQVVAKKADGTYVDQVISHSMAARIDGSQLAQFPQLISRR